MSLSAAEIRVIIDALQSSEWDQATVVIGDVRIAVARNGQSLPGDGVAATPALSPPVAGAVAAAAPLPSPVTPAPASAGPTGTPAAHETQGHVITAPSVGVFWRASEPGGPPFVEIGSRVEPGDTIGIVEVMKLMSNVASDVAGEVVAIHAENSGAVQFGSPLVTIRVGTPG